MNSDRAIERSRKLSTVPKSFCARRNTTESAESAIGQLHRMFGNQSVLRSLGHLIGKRPSERLSLAPAPKEEEEELIRAKRGEEETSEVAAKTEARIDALKGKGTPLPQSVRDFMEPRFGADFGGVRVHTNADASETAQTVNAQAFTVGREIVFGTGYYAPECDAGRRLIAHELTHVVQQNRDTTDAETQNDAPGIARKPESAPSLATLPPPKYLETPNGISLTVYFGPDHFLLLGENFQAVDRLREHPLIGTCISIRVDGHASQEGSSEYNKKLSEKRKLAVEAILSAQGSNRRLPFSGEAYGEESPAVPETGTTSKDIETKRAQNRRVEITAIFPMPSEPKVQRPQLNLNLPQKYSEPTLWERCKIIQQQLEKSEGKQGQSLYDAFFKKVDDTLDSVMSALGVPTSMREFLKEKAKDAIRKGAEALFDQALGKAGLDDQQKKAIKAATEALLKTEVK